MTGRVTDIATFNEGVAHRVWATVAGQGVAYSGDAGTSFAVYSSGLESLQLTGLEVESIGVAHRVWATTSGGSGVAFSDDNGQTWRSSAGNGLDRPRRDRPGDQRGHRPPGLGHHQERRLLQRGCGDDLAECLPGPAIGGAGDLGCGGPELAGGAREPVLEEAGGVFRGASATGVWSSYSSGLDELRVRNISRGSSRTVDTSTKATSFYAATSGAGVFASELRTVSATLPAVSTASLPDGTVKVRLLGATPGQRRDAALHLGGHRRLAAPRVGPRRGHGPDHRQAGAGRLVQLHRPGGGCWTADGAAALLDQGHRSHAPSSRSTTSWSA